MYKIIITINALTMQAVLSKTQQIERASKFLQSAQFLQSALSKTVQFLYFSTPEANPNKLYKFSTRRRPRTKRKSSPHLIENQNIHTVTTQCKGLQAPKLYGLNCYYHIKHPGKDKVWVKLDQIVITQYMTSCKSHHRAHFLLAQQVNMSEEKVQSLNLVR